MRNQSSFEQCYQAGIGNVVGIAQQHADNIESVLPQLHQSHKQLRALGLSAVYAKQDIANQISWLFSPQTLGTLSIGHSSQYPRLVRGIGIRIEKLASQVNKDRQHIADIEALIQPIKDIQNQPLSQELTDELNDFLWLIQEYRISLFAQQLKTRVPVSAKRLDKKWAEISDQLRRFLVKSH